MVTLLGFGLLLVAGLAQRVWAQQAIEKRFNQLDTNRNGKLTPDELMHEEFFRRLDLNGDGEITKSEAARALATGKLKDMLNPPANEASEHPMVKQIEAIAKAADADRDGTITREEAGDAPWFERADHNGDGVVDANEIETIKRAVALMPRNNGSQPEFQPMRPIMADDIRKVTSGPEILKPSEVRIGRIVPDADFTDLAGRKYQLRGLAQTKGVILAMTSATCPVSKRYLGTLAALQKELKGQGMQIVLVNPFSSEMPADIKKQLAAHNFDGIYVHDKDKGLTTSLQAKTTTEVFLLDSQRTLIYRGALDDQYGVNYNLDAPRRRFLVDAVEALRQRRTPQIQATAAPGCELDSPAEKPPVKASVTYHRDVARILQNNCVSCHRDGGIAPFSLDRVDSVIDRARVIKRVVTEGTMPPWFAATPKDGALSPWANDCSLSSQDKADLLAWIESADRPLGDPADAPLPQDWPSQWSIGKPDKILTLSRSYDIKATGFMPYAFDVVETEVTEDKWVTAYEILPSERDVVHHVIVKVHEKGTTVRNVGEGSGGYWAVYVPGNGAQQYPAGFARRLPAGSRMSFQIHYTPSGVAKKERLRIGLVFAKDRPQYEVRTVGVANMGISIPPRAAQHVETKTQRVPFDLPILGFMPHLHIRGKAFKYEATYPDGQSEVLLDIPRYDFNWQLCYKYRQPRLVPRGSTIKVTAIYDNSADNAANPDPDKTVKWGPQTVDEMLIGYIEYFVPLNKEKQQGQKSP
jgi:hypothetical protein